MAMGRLVKGSRDKQNLRELKQRGQQFFCTKMTMSMRKS
jgi:hypothetical protein